MLEFYVESEFKRCQLRQCPVGTHLEGFANWLRSAGYKRRPGQLLLRGAAHLGQWMAARGVRAGDIHAGVLAAFAHHVPTCTCAHPFAGRDRYHREGAQHLVTHWQRVGVVPSPTTAPKTVAPVVEQFSAWMRQHRGVRESTLGNYVPLVQEFLAALGEDAAAYDAARVRTFILARASRSGRGRAKWIVNAVRMFLRFLAVGGACPADLVAAVPTIAHWKLAALPRYLAASDIERLVAACAPTTTAGARDRAVILLCARLGLRAGDVRDLRLGDFDWARGRLRVMGKGRWETWLPLPQEVGDAVVHYLTRFRPVSADDHVFLRVYAPVGPLPSSGPISHLVGRALARAGIAAPSRGAHVLRHSAATALLRQGVALDVIGAVLRHRCVESTAHYAKVDVARLRAVAYLFSDRELAQLLAATARLRPRGSLRPLTYATLFGLLAATGLRVSEALHLVVDDITADGLLVRETKFRKSRLVPLHETTAAALDGYLARRHAVTAGEAHVFVATSGRPLTYPMINGTFHYLLRSVELRTTAGDRAPAPRIHALRHRFAVRALECAAGDRDRIAPHVLALSTYLGHAHVADTYWYLHATPHLMRRIADACAVGGAGGTP